MIDPLDEDSQQASDAEAIASAIGRSVAQAERGETLSVAESNGTFAGPALSHGE